MFRWSCLWHCWILNVTWIAITCRSQREMLEVGTKTSQLKYAWITTYQVPIPIQSGIRQGSVLLPALFNLVMDPLLADVKSRNLCLSIQGPWCFWGMSMTFILNLLVYLIQVRKSNPWTTLQREGSQALSRECGVVISGRHRPCASLATLPVEDVCLGVLWGKHMEFSQGKISAFHRLITPLSSCLSSCMVQRPGISTLPCYWS